MTVHAVQETTPPLLSPPSGGAPESLTAPSNTAGPETSPAPVKPPTPVPAPSPEPVSQAEVAPPVVASSQAPPPHEVSVSKVSLPVPTLTGAAENKTPALDNSDDLALTDQTTIASSTGEALLSTSSAQASSSDTFISQSQITKPNTTSQTSPKSKKTQVPIADKDFDTSERLPVQDSNPPLRMQRTFQEPEEISDPTANEVMLNPKHFTVVLRQNCDIASLLLKGPGQLYFEFFQWLICCFLWLNLMFSLQVVQRNNTVGLPVFNNAPTNSTRTAQATSSTPAEVDMHSPSSIDQEYFSKPGVLQPPEPQQNRAEILPVFQEEPCSTVSDDLEISNATDSSTELGESTSLADQNSAPFASLDSATQSFQDPQYTAAPLTHNQPEEDHYESLYESHTRMNVIRFAEEPSAENMNGQPPSILQRSRVISEDQHTPNYVGTESAVHVSEPSGYDSKKSNTINIREEESISARPEQRGEGRPELFRINNFHLFAAAGIGLSAAFLAWKFTHK